MRDNRSPAPTGDPVRVAKHSGFRKRLRSGEFLRNLGRLFMGLGALAIGASGALAADDGADLPVDVLQRCKKATVLSASSISVLAGGRYGIGTPNDSAISAPPGPPIIPLPPTAPEELQRVWKEYQAKLTEMLRGDQDAYFKDLVRLEGEALRAGDTYSAKALHKEQDSKDPGVAALDIPEDKTSPQISNVRQLRTALKLKRTDAVRALNVWCLAQLEPIKRGFAEHNDPQAAAAISLECDALAKPPLEVMHASYGAGRRVDVTLPLRKAIRFNRIEVEAGNSLAGDPHPYMQKRGSITYRLEGGPEKTVQFGESGTISIP